MKYHYQVLTTSLLWNKGSCLQIANCKQCKMSVSVVGRNIRYVAVTSRMRVWKLELISMPFVSLYCDRMKCRIWKLTDPACERISCLPFLMGSAHQRNSGCTWWHPLAWPRDRTRSSQLSRTVPTVDLRLFKGSFLISSVSGCAIGESGLNAEHPTQPLSSWETSLVDVKERPWSQWICGGNPKVENFW